MRRRQEGRNQNSSGMIEMEENISASQVQFGNVESEGKERAPLMSNFSVPPMRRQDDGKKNVSYLPRNFNSRRRLVIATGVFLFTLVLIQVSSSKGENNLVLLHRRAFLIPGTWNGVTRLFLAVHARIDLSSRKGCSLVANTRGRPNSTSSGKLSHSMPVSRHKSS